MPNLSIIPAQAVMDRTITPTQLRVLCAIGIHTNKLGGGVWASLNTLADEAGVSRSTVKRACDELAERGYLRIATRPGRTHLYEVVLDPKENPVHLDEPTPSSSGRPDTQVIAVTPKRPKEQTPHNEVVGLVTALKDVYPRRPEEPPFPALLKAVREALQAGAAPDRLLRAADRYATHCKLNHTEPKYVKSLVRFLTDGAWQAYDVSTVYGRTREEWARSGQDVLEFDRLLEEASR